MNLTIGAWRVSIEKALPSAAELAKTYDLTKWYWNSFIHRFIFGRAYQRLFKKLLKNRQIADLQNGSKILDVGIGAGVFSESLIKTIKHDYQIFGIDISEKILETAQQNLIRYNTEFHLEKGDARQLPFKEGEMDLVISGLALEHAHDPQTAIREMTRVLRPGSMIILVVTLRYSPDFLTRLLFRYTPLPPEKIMEWMKSANLTNVASLNLNGTARLFGRAYFGEKLNT